MTLSQKIADAVETHARSLGTGAPELIQAKTEAHRIALHQPSGGPVGIAFDELTFAAIHPDPPLSTTDLRAWGDRLAARLTYLMEPLVVLEVDAEAGSAELRSQTPTTRGEVRSFYEVRLGRDRSLRLGRTRFDAANGSRRPTPCQLTGEMLARLTDDLVASLG